MIKIAEVITFQSTHPGWGATLESRQAKAELQFQSTHPGWGATEYDELAEEILAVSIHAPRAGCDTPFYLTSKNIVCFNPRTPGGVRQD